MFTERIKEQAKAKRKQHKKLFDRLRRQPSGQVDQAFERLHDWVFAKTDCLQCANCCKTTSPLFLERDIERLAAHVGLRPADFTSRYLRTDEDGDWVFSTPAPCPFLGTNNYCAVYEARPKACREYPHTNRKAMYQIFDLTLANASICPAVFEIMEKLSEVY